MINQITINSNNTIDLSRGQLLNWLNQLLKTNISKIEQLGTGAIYCQLLDVLYPGKMPMTKVNWKAKFDYQFVNNFKILQQSFTKLNILKHLEVEKLVKCKYQDNLELLQWFRKIFDTSGSSVKQYNPVMRRGDNDGTQKRQKQNRAMHTSRDMHRSNSRNHTQYNDRSLIANCESFITSQIADQSIIHTRFSQSKNQSKIMTNTMNTPQNDQKYRNNDIKIQAEQNAFQQQKQFYLRKFKQIEHLFQSWNLQRSSSQLIQQVRKIILVAPEVTWTIDNGQYAQPPSGLQ